MIGIFFDIHAYGATSMYIPLGRKGCRLADDSKICATCIPQCIKNIAYQKED
jgi:hypothetical protein